MTAALAPAPAAAAPPLRIGLWPRVAPVLIAATLAAGYVIVRPPSVDLAAHLFRARLFAQEGFGIWDNHWYSGHATPGYSVLFPAVAAALSPQLAAALAATATAALFTPLATRHYGSRGLAGASVFAAATAIDLYTGRLALAFGALPALGAIVALDRRRPAIACALAALSALCSPVAALFAALAAAGCALGEGMQVGAGGPRIRIDRVLPGAAVAAAALAPVGLLALAFPEGGTEPFALGTLLPVLAIAIATALLASPESRRLRAGAAVYALVVLGVYLVPSPIGSNIARLGTLLAAPVAVLLWWQRRPVLLAALAVPLVYVGWQAPVLDTASTTGDPSLGAAYYRPLLRFLAAQPGVFRVEIPLTRSHWEAYRVALRFPLARGWERQLDTGDNGLFYSGRLTPAAYGAWLHATAVRFVALPDVPLDYSAQREASLVRAGLPYLRLVMRSAHWRVYAVAQATPLASGAATATALGPDWVGLRAIRAGRVLVRVRFTPYWALAGAGAPGGCVGPAPGGTRLTLRRPGPVRLVIRFAPGRIGADSPRCAPPLTGTEQDRG